MCLTVLALASKIGSGLKHLSALTDGTTDGPTDGNMRNLQGVVIACIAFIATQCVFSNAQIQVCDNTRTPEGVMNFKKLGSDYQGGGYANIKFSFEYKGYTNSGALPGCVSQYKVRAFIWFFHSACSQ
jgi:hypothetical protein